MLPSLGQLSIAPSKGRRNAPAIGMDAGPSNYGAPRAAPSLNGWAVTYDDEDSGERDVLAIVAVDDGDELMLRRQDGSYKTVDKQDVRPIDRAPEEMMQQATPSNAPPPQASPSPPPYASPPVPEDYDGILLAIRETEEQVQATSDATKAQIENFAENVQAASDAKVAWKELEEKKKRAKLEAGAAMPGAADRLILLTAATQNANKKKLKLMAQANKDKEQLDKALAGMKLYLHDLNQARTRLAQQAADLATQKRKDVATARQNDQEAKKQKVAAGKQVADAEAELNALRKKALETPDEEFDSLGLGDDRVREDFMRKWLYEQTQRLARSEASKLGAQTKKAAKDAEAAEAAIKRAEIEKEEALVRANAAAAMKAAEECQDLVCQVHELRAQMEEIGKDAKALMDGIEERKDCNLSDATLSWMRQLAKAAMDTQEAVLDMIRKDYEAWEILQHSEMLKTCKRQDEQSNASNDSRYTLESYYSDEGEGEGEGGGEGEGEGEGGEGGEGAGGLTGPGTREQKVEKLHKEAASIPGSLFGPPDPNDKLTEEEAAMFVDDDVYD